MKKCSVQLPTWSSFPQITCAGAVIRCKLSCSEWRDFSPAISLNTNAHTHTHLKKAMFVILVLELREMPLMDLGCER